MTNQSIKELIQNPKKIEEENKLLKTALKNLFGKYFDFDLSKKN